MKLLLVTAILLLTLLAGKLQAKGNHGQNKPMTQKQILAHNKKEAAQQVKDAKFLEKTDRAVQHYKDQQAKKLQSKYGKTKLPI